MRTKVGFQWTLKLCTAKRVDEDSDEDEVQSKEEELIDKDYVCE